MAAQLQQLQQKAEYFVAQVRFGSLFSFPNVHGRAVPAHAEARRYLLNNEESLANQTAVPSAFLLSLRTSTSLLARFSIAT